MIGEIFFIINDLSILDKYNPVSYILPVFVNVNDGIDFF